MVSVVAVAAHAGVSPATVSRVIAGRVPVATETRARVLEGGRAAGLRPNEVARSLRVGRGRSVGCWSTGDIEQGIYATLAKHVQSELEALGLDLVLFNLGHREDRLRHFLERAPSLGLRGIVLSSPHVMDMDGLTPVMRRRPRAASRYSRSARTSAPSASRSIVHDDVGGGGIGNRAPAGPAAARRSPSSGASKTSAIGRARFDGYRDALHAHGEKLDPALVWDISEGYRADAGYRAMSEALANGLRCRAVLAASDELALGCMAAAADRGLAMPGDIAVSASAASRGASSRGLR